MGTNHVQGPETRRQGKLGHIWRGNARAVEKKVTSITQVKGHSAKAAKEASQFVVKSAKSGKAAMHKPDDLKKG